MFNFKPSNSKNTKKINIFTEIKKTTDKKNAAIKKLLNK